MTCCAFAIMLVTQLLAPLRVVVGWFGLTRAPRPDASVLWAPGLAAPVRIRRSRRPLILAVIAVDLILLATFRFTGAGDRIPRVATPGSDAAQLERLIHQSICGQPDRRA